MSVSVTLVQTSNTTTLQYDEHKQVDSINIHNPYKIINILELNKGAHKLWTFFFLIIHYLKS